MILIDRGNCTFVTKARNIEKAGANVALIGDNIAEHSENKVMSDDGSGHSINIPAFLLRKKSADYFKEYKENGNSVIVKIAIETALSDNTVTVDLWYSTEFDLTEGILAGLKKYIPKFGNSVIFSPRIKTKSCTYCSREEQWAKCLSNGRYCPLSPNLDLPTAIEDVKGSDMLRQSLRLKCIY